MTVSFGREAHLTAQTYQFIVQECPLTCSLLAIDQEYPCWQLKAVRIRQPGEPWQRVTVKQIESAIDEHLVIHLAAEDGTPVTAKFGLSDDQLSVQMRADANEGAWIAVDLAAQADEHYLGLGERFDALDQRGKEVDLWVEDGAQLGITYIPIPFYLSSTGYGLHIDTNRRCVVRLATRDDPSVVSIRNAALALNLTVLPGPTPKEILSKYTAITGRAELPPPWVFGPWKSRDWQTADQTGIHEDVEQQHQLDLPATVKLIDARWEVAYHTFAFDPHKFPDPRAMIDDIHAYGSRLVVWLSPWMAVDNGDDPNDAFYACAERDYLIKNPKGEIYVHRLGNNPLLVGSCIDFTNPEAAAWWQDNIRRLAEMGVSGINTDFGEQVPEDAVFNDGRTGREMHNIYPRLYNELTYEALLQARGDTREPGVLLARSGWHGTQRLSAIWAGDQTSDFGYNSGLRTAIIAGQSAGLSGFSYWASDIGGYFGTPSDEVYMRWTQLGAFSPIMMIHGAGRREPWTFSSQTLDTYRRYARLHTDLFPYIYTHAHTAARTGLPIMRAMALEFPEDPGVWGDLPEHQYLFGADLLVAPVYYGFARTRKVYLPAGLWRDFWNGELIEGGQTVARQAEVDQIPVFARAGAIIPWLDPSPDTLVPASQEGVRSAGDDLRIDVYPGASGLLDLYDGTRFSWDEPSQTLTISDSPLRRQVSVRRVGTAPTLFTAAVCAGSRLPVEESSLSGEAEYRRVWIEGQAVALIWDG